MFNNFGFEICKIFKLAEKERIDLCHPYVGTEHLVLAILKNENEVSTELENYDLTYHNFKQELISVIGKSNKKFVINLYTPLLKKVIENAIVEAKETNNGVVTENLLLVSLLEEGEGIAIRLMIKMGIDVDELYDSLRMRKSNSKKTEIMNLGSCLNDKVEENDIIYGREEEITRIIETLLRKKKNNPLLVGNAGVGKTAIVEEIARRIKIGSVPSYLKDKKIISLEMGSLVAGTKYRGEFEERLNKIIKELLNDNNIILFIDEIHTIINAGGAEGAINATDILKPYLARGDIKCIGATTKEEYYKTINKDKALDRRFELINIDEPNEEKTIEILTKIKNCYELHHNIEISENNIADIVYFANKYIKNKYNPDKSIDLLDSVCAKVKVASMNNVSFNKWDKLEQIIKAKEESVANNDFEKAIDYHQEELNIKNSNDGVISKITRDDILEVLEKKTNIPLLLNKNELLIKIENNLMENILGQESALNKIMLNLKKKFKYDNKPLSLLLTGPSGVGKTESVKVISKIINPKDKLIRLDMSEYNLETSVNKLIGVSSGYVGYDDNYIFRKVMDNPYSVILVDEIEKAHSSVINLFLQILDEGFVTDSKGNIIDFNNTFIFMTSNVVSKNLGFSNINKNNDTFSKEFMARFDDIIEYQELNENVIKEYISKNNISDVDKILADSNYKEYGLRNVKKLIEKEIYNN